MMQLSRLIRIINPVENPRIVVQALWFMLNVALFLYFFFLYYNSEEYYYLREILGLGLSFARGSAGCLNLNCMFALFPVCRNLISRLRQFSNKILFKKRAGNVIARILDKNLYFHRLVAYFICFHTIVHIMAHGFNLENFVYARDAGGLVSKLSSLPSGSDNNTWINPVRTSNTHPMIEVWKILAGVSGIVITSCLIVIFTSSTELMRRSAFEKFWFSHHLFIIFYIGLIVHGFQGVVGVQTNLKQHNPKKCAEHYLRWGSPDIPECPMPLFQRGRAKTWKWLILPIVLYFIERLIRELRRFESVTIEKVVFHPSRVFELQMKKKNFSAQPGEYIFLQCSNLSRLEWHPFTLTSCPNDPYFSVHIRCVGDWTNSLERLLKKCQSENIAFPRIAVDGPFGTASEDAFKYEIAILIGAGIGITPFAAVLKDIKSRLDDPNLSSTLKEVHLIWLCPEAKSFEWFSQMLVQLELELQNQNRHGFLYLNIYLTRGWDGAVIRRVLSNVEDDEDCLTGLRQKTSFGRPNWELIFKQYAEKYKGHKIGVFFCGPQILSRELHRRCKFYTSSGVEGVKFFYNKENF